MLVVPAVAPEGAGPTPPIPPPPYPPAAVGLHPADVPPPPPPEKYLVLVTGPASP